MAIPTVEIGEPIVPVYIRLIKFETSGIRTKKISSQIPDENLEKLEKK